MNLTAAQWKSLNEHVKSELGEWYTARSKRLFPEGQSVVDHALSRGGLRGGVKVRHLLEPAILLGDGESPDGLIALARICQHVPFTGNYGIWEPVRATFAMTMRQLTLAGDPRSRDCELLVCWPENGEQPGPIALTPPAVNRANGLVVEQLRSDFNPPLKRQQFSHTIERVRELNVMWALGGSERWPRDRIDHELDAASALISDYVDSTA